MTGPTRAPNALGEGSWTAMPSAPTNGHTAPYGFGRSAGVLPGDQRTFDDIEAGIVALWQRFGEGRQQRLRDRLVPPSAPLGLNLSRPVGNPMPAHLGCGLRIPSRDFSLV